MGALSQMTSLCSQCSENTEKHEKILASAKEFKAQAKELQI